MMEARFPQRARLFNAHVVALQAVAHSVSGATVITDIGRTYLFQSMIRDFRPQ